MRVRRIYCERCHFNFLTEALFFEHRVGTYKPLTRHCLTPQEMRDKGWVCQAMDVRDQGITDTWSLPGQLEAKERATEKFRERHHH